MKDPALKLKKNEKELAKQTDIYAIVCHFLRLRNMVQLKFYNSDL